MKTGIIFSGLAIALTCLAFTSCDWFTKKKAAQKQPELLGKWVLTNVADSSKDERNGVGILALAIASKDSMPFSVEFKTDSSCITSADTLKYYTDSAKQAIFIFEDSTAKAYIIKSHTDSSLQLFSTEDSVWYTLQKSK